jgi:hypothetical protein
MGVTSVLVLLLLGCLLSLTPLALASPPDPPWIAGIYDDVVCLLTSSSGAIETVDLAKARPLLRVAGGYRLSRPTGRRALQVSPLTPAHH